MFINIKIINVISSALVFIIINQILFVSGISGDENESFEPPRLVLKLIIDSYSEKCRICAKKTRNRAFKILNQYFYKGRIIQSRSDCSFIKTYINRNNELLPECYKTREIYRNTPEKGVEEFPLITFKFHTKKNHLIGILQKDYTHQKFEDIYRKSTYKDRFFIKIKIIYYKYGDGPTCNYFRDKNQLQVHCKILDMNLMNK